MNDEHTLKLYTDFPTLYRQHSLSMMETCMCWGFECEDGWFDLIYKLSKDLTDLDATVEASQVKEKFGGLRFYTSGSGVSLATADKVFKLIDIAEDESYETCEQCGTKENVSQNKHGWIFTLCDDCRQKRKEEREEYAT